MDRKGHYRFDGKSHVRNPSSVLALLLPFHQILRQLFQRFRPFAEAFQF